MKRRVLYSGRQFISPLSSASSQAGLILPGRGGGGGLHVVIQHKPEHSTCDGPMVLRKQLSDPRYTKGGRNPSGGSTYVYYSRTCNYVKSCWMTDCHGYESMTIVMDWLGVHTI